MSATTADFMRLVGRREGHFRMESGLHSALWLDLDALFADPVRIAPFVVALANELRPYAPDAVCGPLLGGAFLAQRLAEELRVEFCFTERVTVSDGLFGARYALPETYRARVRGKRIAMVDDVMSAGSSLRATFTELVEHGGTPIVSGALLVLGSTGADYFRGIDVPVAATFASAFESWKPGECALCAAGIELEEV